MPPAIRARFAACLPLVLAAVLLAPAAAAEPLTGRYQARPGAVFACGGLFGDCEVLQLEGWVEIETFALTFPGSPPAVRFLASDLRLRALDDGSVVPFPAATDLQLAELEVTSGSVNNIDFASPPGAAQTVQLNLWGVVDPEAAGETHVLLRGVYDEGCCDRFSYEIGGVIFDWTAPLGEPPALRLADGFSVMVEWRDDRGGSGVATPITFDDRSGHFWFFRPDNPELLVKTIDACEPFGRWWFFAAGLTNVEVTLRVEGPGGERTYTSTAGEPFAPILDTDAFPCL
jgi:hypothetical protein